MVKKDDEKIRTMKLKAFFEKNRTVLLWALFAGTTVAVFLLGLLAASVTERRAEIATLFNNKRVEITGIESRSQIWERTIPESTRPGNRPQRWISKVSTMVMRPLMFWSKDQRW